MRLTLKVTDSASSKIFDLLELKGRKGYAIAATAMRERMREHFVMMDKRPNRNGWPKQHFFGRARRQTSSAFDDQHAEVRVSLVGFKTHVTGKPGIIRPVNKVYLTIPARSEAYGKRAGEFNDLRIRFGMTDDGVRPVALVQAEQTKLNFGRKKKDGSRSTNKTEIGGLVYFWLVKSAHTKPHPKAMPTEKQLQDAVSKELTAYIDSHK